MSARATSRKKSSKTVNPAKWAAILEGIVVNQKEPALTVRVTPEHSQ